jgi:transcription initiation factor IIE alpha subunit
MEQIDTREQALEEWVNRGTIKDLVFSFIPFRDSITNQELSDVTGYDINFITRATTDLQEEGLIKHDVQRACKITGKFVNTWIRGKEIVPKSGSSLTNAQMEKVKKYIILANQFQKDKIIDWCNNGTK